MRGEFALAGVIEEQVADVSSVYSGVFDILQIENVKRTGVAFQENVKNNLRIL